MVERRSLTVLVVEDEALLRVGIVDCLTRNGHRVCEAGSGEAAMAILETRDIGALFTDISLGGAVSGWDVAEGGRAIDPALPVVYTSGNDADRERMVVASRFFGKPYDEDGVRLACEELAAGATREGRRYFFAIEDGVTAPDDAGTVLASPEEARREAMSTMGEILRHSDPAHLDGAPLRITVTDEEGGLVFGLEVVATAPS